MVFHFHGSFQGVYLDEAFKGPLTDFHLPLCLVSQCVLSEIHRQLPWNCNGFRGSMALAPHDVLGKWGSISTTDIGHLCHLYFETTVPT